MSSTINAQQSWITGQLEGRHVPHAFVFAHKGLITCNHADVLFSESNGTPADNPAYTDAFMASLARNNVKYYIHGHDHMHDRSIVTDTTGKTPFTSCSVLPTAQSFMFRRALTALSRKPAP